MVTSQEVVKKRKTKPVVITTEATKQKKLNYRIFQPFRAVGYVTNDIPFTLQTRGTASFLTTCVGKSFHIYDCTKLNLLFVGPQTQSSITAIASSNDVTFVACDREVIVFNRAKEITRFVSNTKGSIFSLLVLGNFLIGLCDSNIVIIWNHHSGELYTEMQLDTSFTVSVIVHPHTYLDKILLGSTQGTMQIWNMRTNKLIYSFSSFGSSITSLTQTPVIDVIAVGLLDGTIILHNIRADERIKSYNQEGRVTSISFGTDGQHIMATANMHGDIALWDLEKKQLVHVMNDAHDGLIPSIQFLNGQPILITSGADNSVKEWIFDSPYGLPRLLKSRSGHHAPPTMIQYYGSDGHFILSAAGDRSLRAFSIVRDSQSVELSQGSLERKSKKLDIKSNDLKLPQIVQFSASEAKQQEWDNILTCHLGHNFARTWSYQNKTIGNHIFTPLDGSSVKVTSVSPCGNFGFIGSATGQIDLFNMQSGKHRRTFAGSEKHKKSISGLASDPLNRVLISTSLDGTVKIWDFITANVLHTIHISSPITILRFQTENNLIAIASDDFTIRIIDVDTYKIVREFAGHRNRITDLTFSPDGRWIISCSLDSTICTWDLPSGYLIDVFRVDNVATSVTFSPTGDFLATSHVDNVGIFLWANRTQFADISVRSVSDDEIFDVCLPTTSGIDSDIEEDISLNSTTIPDVNAVFMTAEQLTEEMITLSTLPKSKWQNLLNLETIKKRNKPKEPPKAPEKAPFFLPTLPGVEQKFVSANSNDMQQGSDEKAKHDKKTLHLGEIRMETKVIKLLKKNKAEGDYTEFFDFMKSLNPSAIDFELRSLNLGDNFSDLKLFLDAVQSRLTSKKDFEIVEAYLNHFLKIHGDIIVANPDELGTHLRSILQVHRKEWIRIEEMLHYNLCMLDFLRK